jgi:PAS domain S-box-containing protein
MENDGLQRRIADLQAQVNWLEDERKNLEWLFEAVPAAFVVLDENCFITESNLQLQKMLGFRHASLDKINFASLVVKQDASAFLQHLRSSKLASGPVRIQIRLRTGRVGGLPVELVTLASVTRASNGRASYRIAIIDLAKRVVAEEKVRETLQSFSTLLDTVEGIVWEADGATLDVTFVSRYAEKMLGYPIAHWLKTGFWERHIYVDDRESVMHELTRALAEKRALSLDYRVLTNDRRLLWIHDRIGIRSQNGKVKLLGIAVDMTEQKNIETELEKERSNLESRVAERTAQLQTTISELEAFSYSLSHDMRAPLRAMEGYTQLLQNILADKLGPKEIDFFGRIMASAERLDNLIQDVLQYSRVARVPLELKEINLEKIVNQVISDYPHLQPPGADIRMQKPLMQALGHEAFLTQCISNLLSNAVKFVAPGVKPKVTVYTRPYGREMRLFVEDNGIGIPADNQKQIFGIFQRLHPHTAYPGTGIGLAIVQKAVQRMGGQVGVESTLGKGSTFWLQLKRAA